MTCKIFEKKRKKSVKIFGKYKRPPYICGTKANNMTTQIKNLTIYSNLQDAFENGTGDRFFVIDGGYFCCSEWDEIFEVLIDAGYNIL